MSLLLYAGAVLLVIGAGFGGWLAVKSYLARLVDRRIFAFQSDLITRHCAEVEHIYTKMRGWRHDYHQHMQVLTAHLAMKQYDEIGTYLSKLNDDLTSVDNLIKTGNTMVDAILNSKISLAQSAGINVKAKAVVPESLCISEIDLCVVIGNLFDNAVEACLKLPAGQERSIRLYIDIFRENLYISVSNTSGGEPVKEGKQYITTKGAGHGFGLLRLDAVAEKYGGWVNRQHEDGVFATEVMIPV